MNGLISILIAATWAIIIVRLATKRPAARKRRPATGPTTRPRSRPLGPRAGGALPSEHELDR